MRTVSTVPYASLGMYPFEWLVPAWEALWRVVHAHAPWTPPELSWTDDVHSDWRTTECVAAHACGWPVAAQLGGLVEVVGAFSLRLPEARGHEYRSVLLARDPAVLDLVGHPGLVAAANSEDSLSGWVSFLAALNRPSWPGPILWTGAHRQSLAALADGQADLACIDALSLAHLVNDRPNLADGLHQVGVGPWVPSPAVVVRAGTPVERRRQLAEGLRAAVADPDIGGPLRYDGFVELDGTAYQPTLHLVPAA